MAEHNLNIEIINFEQKDLEEYRLEKIKNGMPRFDCNGMANPSLTNGFVEHFAANYFERLGYKVIRNDFQDCDIMPAHLRFSMAFEIKSYPGVNLERRVIPYFNLKSKKIDGIIKYDEKNNRYYMNNKSKIVWRFPLEYLRERIINVMVGMSDKKAWTKSYLKINKLVLKNTGIIAGKLGIKNFNLLCLLNTSFLGSHPDLFVYNDKEAFFVEVKSEKDQMKLNQLVFISLAKYIYKICDCKILKVLPLGKTVKNNIIKWPFEETFEKERFGEFLRLHTLRDIKSVSTNF